MLFKFITLNYMLKIYDKVINHFYEGFYQFIYF